MLLPVVSVVAVGSFVEIINQGFNRFDLFLQEYPGDHLWRNGKRDFHLITLS